MTVFDAALAIAVSRLEFRAITLASVPLRDEMMPSMRLVGGQLGAQFCHRACLIVCIKANDITSRLRFEALAHDELDLV